MSRLSVLADLHWSLLHPLSDAEKAFRDAELPALHQADKDLQQDLKVCRLSGTVLLLLCSAQHPRPDR